MPTGQPRVGNPAFSAALDHALGPVTFRYVNDLDVVPHLPPTRLAGRTMLRAPASVLGEQFSHVGQLRLFQRDGSLSSDEQEWPQREVIYSGTFLELLKNSPNLLRAQLGQVLRGPHRLLDHDPLRGYLPKLEARLR